MKKVLISILFFVGLIPQLQAQLRTTNFDYEADKPLILKAGETISIIQPKMVLISFERYQFYKEIHEYFQQESALDWVDNIIQSYKKTIVQNEGFLKKMAFENNRLKTTINQHLETNGQLLKSMTHQQQQAAAYIGDLKVENIDLKLKNKAAMKPKILRGIGLTLGGVFVGFVAASIIVK